MKWALDPKPAFESVQELLAIGIEGILRDELFIQLVTQTTQNPNV